MKALIIVDVPDYQMGQEVSVYFKDTMCIKSICQEDSTIKELKKIRAEILNEYPYAESDKARLIGYGIHIALEYIDKHISELKGENNG